MEKLKSGWKYLKENIGSILSGIVLAITILLMVGTIWITVAGIFYAVEEGEVIEERFEQADIQEGTVEDKFVWDGGNTTTVMPEGKTLKVRSKKNITYGIIVDDMAFEIERQEWNIITEGEDIEYKYLDTGEFRLMSDGEYYMDTIGY